MRTRLQNLLAILSLLLCLLSLTFGILSYSTSYSTGKIYARWSTGKVYSSFCLLSASDGRFCLRFGHKTMPMYTTDSPEWPTLTPAARQRFVRWHNDNPDTDEWILQSEPHSLNPGVLKDSLIGFESFKPIGLDVGNFTICPAWFATFLFALLPAFHFRRKIFKPPPWLSRLPPNRSPPETSR